MRPTKIRIDGFRSYRGGRAATIDFADLETAAIVGDTGAGKSSILEALTWALYGEISSGAKVLQHVMNDNADRMSVTLELEVNERRFTVHRAARRTRKGTVVADGVLLTETAPGASGGETTVAEGATAVLRKVRELIGMNCDAFLRTTILPQGRFSRLLAEDDQAVRAAVLRQIWATDEIDQAREIARRAASWTRGLKLRAEQERAGKPDDTNAHEAQLALAADTDEGAASAAGRRVRRHREAADEETTARRAADDARKLHEESRETLRHAAGTRELPERRNELQALETQRDECGERVENLAKTWNAAAASLQPEEIEREGRILEKLEMHVTATDQMIRERLELAGQIPEVERAAADARDAAATAEAARSDLQAEVATTDAELRTARDTLYRVDEQLRAAERATEEITAKRRTSLKRATERLEESRRNEARHVETRRAIEARLTEAHRARTDAATALADAEAGNHAAAAAAGKSPGTPCPVCDQPLPEYWRAPEAREVEQLRAEAQRTIKRVDALKEEAAAGDGAIRHARQTQQDAEEEIREAEGAIATIEQRLYRHLEVDADGTPPGPEAVEQARSRLAATAGSAADHVATLETTRTGAVERLETAAAKAARLRHKADVLTQNAAEIRERLATTDHVLEERITTWMALGRAARRAGRTGHPDASCATARDLGPDGTPETLTRSHAAKTLEAIRQARDANRDRARERDALQTTQLQAQSALQAANAACDEHKRERIAPLEALEQRARHGIERLAEALDWPEKRRRDTTTGLDDRPEAAPVYHTAAELARIAGERLTAALAALDTATAAAAAEHESVPEAHRADPATWLESMHESAVKRAAASRWQLEVFRASMPAIRELDDFIANATSTLEKLDELSRNLSGGQFPKYVTLRRSASLLAHASRHLRAMTADRYAFLDPRDTEERWTVLDRHTGHTREPGQLSGGEQFLASVALALGAVETVSRIGGRIQTLFIDEGFGALDRASLARAIKGIHRASKQRHLIVLVSHVRDVAAAADDVILVETGPDGGSTAAKLDEREKALLTDPESDDADRGLLGAA